MSKEVEDTIHIVVAEGAPILAVGLSHILMNLPQRNIYVTELKTIKALEKYLSSEHAEILIIDPAFGGGFNPEHIRQRFPDLKIVAFQSAPLENKVMSMYDEIISVVDDMDSIADKINRIISSADRTEAENKEEMLSQREKEIVALVVKGLTNKEIADHLYLSIHTVITHRRNIARKLEIHSATGLTIYAIVNKIVDLSEIKL